MKTLPQPSEPSQPISRRRLVGSLAGGLAAGLAAPLGLAAERRPFRLRQMVASSLYGRLPLETIVPEVRRFGATALDIWPQIHGNQREELDRMGEAAFSQLLRRHGVTLECITQFKLGPLALGEEMLLAARLGCRLIVTGAVGPKGLEGAPLRAAVVQFVEKMKPHTAAARRAGVTIAIENHSGGLIAAPDSLRWLAELGEKDGLGIAFAPYHLPQDPALLASLIRELGNRIQLFYAWEHGMGCMTKLPTEQQLLQLPGRGKLDFRPLLDALRAIDYRGWTEVFMHPTPRGIPILPTAREVTDELVRARDHLESRLSSNLD